MHDYRYIISLILKQSYVVITDNTDGIECLHYWDKLGYVIVLLTFINELIIMWKDHSLSQGRSRYPDNHKQYYIERNNFLLPVSTDICMHYWAF